MENLFVDTSAWVALFVKNDEEHQRAVSLFERIKSLKSVLYTSDYVFDETLTTILVRGSYRQSLLAGEALLNSNVIKILPVSSEYFQEAWKLYQKYRDKQFSFTDVTSFAIMRDMEINKVFAFDNHFSQAGFELLTL